MHTICFKSYDMSDWCYGLPTKVRQLTDMFFIVRHMRCKWWSLGLVGLLGPLGYPEGKL